MQVVWFESGLVLDREMEMWRERERERERASQLIEIGFFIRQTPSQTDSSPSLYEYKRGNLILLLSTFFRGQVRVRWNEEGTTKRADRDHPPPCHRWHNLGPFSLPVQMVFCLTSFSTVTLTSNIPTACALLRCHTHKNAPS